MTPPLTPEELEYLRAFNTPTIANALERLGLKDSYRYATDSSIRCLFPEMKPIVGYACTAAIRSLRAAKPETAVSRKAYWEYVLQSPAPRIVVVQELDQPPAGAFWGEVNATIHWRLGCLGMITDGTVRDLDEVRIVGFQFLAAGVSVTHAYSHLVDFGKTVMVGGMTVRPGNLIHADRHGAMVLPAEMVSRLASAVGEVERYERPLLQLCKSPDFSTEKLAELLARDSV